MHSTCCRKTAYGPRRWHCHRRDHSPAPGPVPPLPSGGGCRRSVGMATPRGDAGPTAPGEGFRVNARNGSRRPKIASRVRFTTVRPEGRAKNDCNPHFSRARIRYIESESRAEAKIISVACARPIMCTRPISVHRFRGRHREPQRSSLPHMAANTMMGVVVRSITGVDRPFATAPHAPIHAAPHASQAPRQVTRVKTLIHVTPDEPAVGYFSLIMACIDTQFPFACAMRIRLGKSRSMRRRGK